FSSTAPAPPPPGMCAPPAGGVCIRTRILRPGGNRDFFGPAGRPIHPTPVGAFRPPAKRKCSKYQRAPLAPSSASSPMSPTPCSGVAPVRPFHPPVRPARARRSVLAVRPLEGRLAPAGLVHADLSTTGVLTLTGDDDDNGLT